MRAGSLRCGRAGRAGSHQLHRPNSATSAGMSRQRMMVASMRMPAPRPVARIALLEQPPRALPRQVLILGNQHAQA